MYTCIHVQCTCIHVDHDQPSVTITDTALYTVQGNASHECNLHCHCICTKWSYNVSGSPDFYLVVSSVAALQEVIIQRSWAVAAQVSLK